MIKYCEDFREYLVLVISGYLFVIFQINFNYEHVSDFDTFTVNINKIFKIISVLISHVVNEQGTGYEHIFSSVQTFNIY